MTCTCLWTWVIADRTDAADRREVRLRYVIEAIDPRCLVHGDEGE